MSGQDTAGARAVKIHPALLIADLAFDVNLLIVLKREGFTIREGADRMDR